MLPVLQNNFISELSLVKSAIKGGHTSNACTTILYKLYTSHYSDLRVDHRLQDPCLPRIKLLQVVGHRVCNRYYSKQPGVRADLVTMAWHAIIDDHLSESLIYPRKSPNLSSTDFDKCLSCMLRHYLYQDPPLSEEKQSL